MVKSAKTSPKTTPPSSRKSLSPKVSPKTSPKGSPKTSPKASPKTSPLHSGASPKTSPLQSKTSTSGQKNVPSFQSIDVKSTIYKSSKVQPEDGPMTPSFGSKFDDIVPPSAAATNAIVKSHKESDKEGEYHTLGPKHKEMPFKQLLISNIVLTVFNLILLCVWIYLLSIFTWENTEDYMVPLDKLKDVLQFCREQKAALDSRCVYAKEKYATGCTPILCLFVTLQIIESNVSLYPGGHDETMNMYTFKPMIERSIHVSSNIDFVHCAPSSWCVEGTCEKVHEGDARLVKYDAEPAVIGRWKLTCNKGEVQCFEKGQATHLLTINGHMECNDENKEKTCGNATNRRTLVPHSYVRFAYRSCNLPIPMYGGSPCWNDNHDELSNAVVAHEICHPCANHTELPENCTVGKTARKECTVKCPGNEEEFYLPNSYNCTIANNTKGFCFHGICAPFMQNETCYYPPSHSHDHDHSNEPPDHSYGPHDHSDEPDDHDLSISPAAETITTA